MADYSDLVKQLREEAEARRKEDELRQIFGEEGLAQAREYQKRQNSVWMKAYDTISEHMETAGVSGGEAGVISPTGEEPLAPETPSLSRMGKWLTVGVAEATARATELAIDTAANVAKVGAAITPGGLVAGRALQVLGKVPLPKAFDALDLDSGAGPHILADTVAKKYLKDESKYPSLLPEASRYINGWIDHYTEKVKREFKTDPEGVKERVKKGMGLLPGDVPQDIFEGLSYVAPHAAETIAEYGIAGSLTKGSAAAHLFHMALVDAYRAYNEGKGPADIAKAAAHGAFAQGYLGLIGRLPRLSRAVMTAGFFGGAQAAAQGVSAGMKYGADVGLEVASEVFSHPENLANTVLMTALSLRHPSISREDAIRFVGDVGRRFKVATDIISKDPSIRGARAYAAARAFYGLEAEIISFDERRDAEGVLIEPDKTVVSLPDGSRHVYYSMTGERSKMFGEGLIQWSVANSPFQRVVPARIEGMPGEEGAYRARIVEGAILTDWYQSNGIVLVQLTDVRGGGIEWKGDVLTETGAVVNAIDVLGRPITIPPTSEPSLRRALWHEKMHLYRAFTRTGKEFASDIRELWDKTVYDSSLRGVRPEEIEELAKKYETIDGGGRPVLTEREKTITGDIEETAVYQLEKSHAKLFESPGVVRRVATGVKAMVDIVMPSEVRAAIAEVSGYAKNGALRLEKGTTYRRTDKVAKGIPAYLDSEYAKVKGIPKVFSAITEVIRDLEAGELIAPGQKLPESVSGINIWKYGQTRNLVLPGGPAKLPVYAHKIGKELGNIARLMPKLKETDAYAEGEGGDLYESEGAIRFIMPDGTIIVSVDRHSHVYDQIFGRAIEKHPELLADFNSAEEYILDQQTSLPGYLRANPIMFREFFMMFSAGAVRVSDFYKGGVGVQFPYKPTLEQVMVIDRMAAAQGGDPFRLVVESIPFAHGVSGAALDFSFSGTARSNMDARRYIEQAISGQGVSAAERARTLADLRRTALAPAVRSVLYETAMGEKFPSSVNPDQLINLLKKGGVKDEELKWTNIAELVSSKKRAGERIAKQELLDWIRTMHTRITYVVEGAGGEASEVYRRHTTETVPRIMNAVESNFEGTEGKNTARALARAIVSPFVSLEDAAESMLEFDVDSSGNIWELGAKSQARKALLSAISGSIEDYDHASKLKKLYPERTKSSLIADPPKWWLTANRVKAEGDAVVLSPSDLIEWARWASEHHLASLVGRLPGSQVVKSEEPTGEGEIQPDYQALFQIEDLISYVGSGATTRAEAEEMLKQGSPASWAAIEADIPSASIAAMQIREMMRRTTGGHGSYSSSSEFGPGEAVPEIDEVSNVLMTWAPPGSRTMRAFGTLEGVADFLDSWFLGRIPTSQLRTGIGSPLNQSQDASRFGRSTIMAWEKQGYTYEGLHSFGNIPPEAVEIDRPGSIYPPGTEGDEIKVIRLRDNNTGKNVFLLSGTQTTDYEGRSHHFNIGNSGAGILGWARGAFFKMSTPSGEFRQWINTEDQSDYLQSLKDFSASEKRKTPPLSGVRDPSQLAPSIKWDEAEKASGGRLRVNKLSGYRIDANAWMTMKGAFGGNVSGEVRSFPDAFPELDFPRGHWVAQIGEELTGSYIIDVQRALSVLRQSIYTAAELRKGRISSSLEKGEKRDGLELLRDSEDDKILSSSGIPSLYKFHNDLLDVETLSDYVGMQTQTSILRESINPTVPNIDQVFNPSSVVGIDHYRKKMDVLEGRHSGSGTSLDDFILKTEDEPRVSRGLKILGDRVFIQALGRFIPIDSSLSFVGKEIDALNFLVRPASRVAAIRIADDAPDGTIGRFSSRGDSGFLSDPSWMDFLKHIDRAGIADGRDEAVKLFTQDKIDKEVLKRVYRMGVPETPYMEQWRDQLSMEALRYAAETGSPYFLWSSPASQFSRNGTDMYQYLPEPVQARGPYEFTSTSQGRLYIDKEQGPQFGRSPFVRMHPTFESMDSDTAYVYIGSLISELRSMSRDELGDLSDHILERDSHIDFRWRHALLSNKDAMREVFAGVHGHIPSLLDSLLILQSQLSPDRSLMRSIDITLGRDQNLIALESFFGLERGKMIYRYSSNGGVLDESFEKTVTYAENALGRKTDDLVTELNSKYADRKYLASLDDPDSDVRIAWRYSVRQHEGGYEIVRSDSTTGKTEVVGSAPSHEEAMSVVSMLPKEPPPTKYRVNSTRYEDSQDRTPEWMLKMGEEEIVDWVKRNRGIVSAGIIDTTKSIEEIATRGGRFSEKIVAKLFRRIKERPKGGVLFPRYEGNKDYYDKHKISFFKSRLKKFNVEPTYISVRRTPEWSGKQVEIKTKETIVPPKYSSPLQIMDYSTEIDRHRAVLQPVIEQMAEGDRVRIFHEFQRRLELDRNPMPLILWARQYAPEFGAGMESMDPTVGGEPNIVTEYTVFYRTPSGQERVLEDKIQTLDEATSIAKAFEEMSRSGSFVSTSVVPVSAPEGEQGGGFKAVVRRYVPEAEYGERMDLADLGRFATREEAEAAAAERQNISRKSTEYEYAIGFPIRPEHGAHPGLLDYLLFTSRPKFRTQNLPPVYTKIAEEAELAGFKDLIDPNAHPELVVGGKILGINLDKVNTPEDVKRAILATSKIYEHLIDKSRRYTRSHTLTKATADALGMTVDDLMARNAGEAYNAEQLYAAFNLAVAGGRVLSESARMFDINPTPENEARFLHALGLQRELQAQFGGARAEAGRSLDILREMAGGEGNYLKKVGEALARHGGGPPAAVARMITKLPTLTQASRFVAHAQRATTTDVLLEVWINSLLSGPKTTAANLVGNMMTMLNAPLERAVAGIARGVSGGGEGVAIGEPAAMISGVMSGFREALQILAKTAVTEPSMMPEALARPRMDDPSADLSKIDLPQKRAISAKALGASGTFGKALDVIGRIVRTPGGVLNTTDQFFKLVNYRMELAALAHRTATEENLSGDARRARVADILSGKDKEAFDLLADSANSWADFQTFTNVMSPTEEALLRWSNSSPWTKLIIPFVRTPVNIFHYALDRTPIINLAQKRMWEDIRAGGARRDLAISKISTSAFLLATVAGMAASGMISGYGPSDKELRKQKMATGWQPWSIKVGGTWYAYDRLDPIGAVLGAGATFSEMHGELPDAEIESLALMYAIAFSRSMLSKTYLTGIARVTDAVADPQANAKTVLRSYLGTAVPGFMSQADTALFDQQVRELWTYTDILKDRIPGLSETLPPKRDIFGKPVYYPQSLGPDYLSPIKEQEEAAYPAMQELVKQKVRVAPADKWIYGSKPTGAFSPALKEERISEGVPLSPEQYDRISSLRGSIAEKLIMEAMGTPEYRKLSDGPDGGKAHVLRKAFTMATRQAKQQLLAEYPELMESVSLRMRERAMKKSERTEEVPFE